jgi:alpha-mannosidase
MNKLFDKKVFHIISNTHWDREWRFSFQRNRQMLVDMIDALLVILETEVKYKVFHLDSQSIVLKDYLEIKPQNRSRIEKLVKEKRLLIGPWYILPEEFQVGGENLIRNLLLGHKTSKQFGRVSKIGYSPFSWGQISQLPQIYKEFGIDLIMFYRGVNSIDSPKAEFLWEGADGTHAISSRFSTMPRYNFYFYIYRPVVHKEDFSSVEYNWERGGTPFHFADNEQKEEDYFILSPIDTYYEEMIEPSVNAIIEKQVNDFTTPHVIWMEGHDSSGPNVKTVNIIQDIQKRFPGIEVRHSSLETYAKEVFSSVNIEKLKKVKGERRSAQFDLRSGNLYGYTTSARMYLKQKNYEAEQWLQFYAEPFNVISGILGRDIKDLYVDYSWEQIIQNSAHDSIGGCSLDAIHEDMMFRYKQSIEVSKGVFERSVKYLVNNISTASFAKGNKIENEIFLVVINPNLSLRDGIAEAYVDVPFSIDLGGIKIISADGKELEYQMISRKQCQPVLEQMIDRPMYFNMVRYNIYLSAQNIPPLGYKTLKVVPVKAKKAVIKQALGAMQNKLENKFLKVTINKNGTFSLTVKPAGKIYTNLGYFADEGENGHAWVHQTALPVITTLQSNPKVKLITHGSLRNTFKISHKLLVPKYLNERKKKNFKKGSIEVDLFLTLDHNGKHLEVKIDVNNNAESHRLRIMFPTKLNARYSYGEGQFDVVERLLERPDTKNWVEQPMYDFPMHQFVDLTDKKDGFAVLPNGLKEYEVLNDKEKTLAVTLIRGFESVIAPSSKQDYSYQKGSQCLGKSSYRLAVYPHKANWITGEVYKEALNFSNPLRLVQIGKANGNLPLELSFLKFSSKNLQFSSFKKSENDDDVFVLRVFNPTGKTITSKLTFYQSIKQAELVSLEEVFKEKISLNNPNTFTITLTKRKIATVKLYFEKKEE